MSQPDDANEHKTLHLTHKARSRAHSELQGFVDFIRNQGVMGLAIGFVIGTQAKALVDQMSKSFIDPILGLIVGDGGGLSQKAFHLTLAGQKATFAWGAFAYALINFVIIAAIIYYTFKWLRLEKLDKKKDK